MTSRSKFTFLFKILSSLLISIIPSVLIKIIIIPARNLFLALFVLPQKLELGLGFDIDRGVHKIQRGRPAARTSPRVSQDYHMNKYHVGISRVIRVSGLSYE